MDSTEKNIDHMITEIKKKLQLVNQDMIRSENYSAECYDELRDIYELVMSKPSVSISEMEAILSELGNIRDK
ncbi:MAG TPA: DUF1128 domain-containing protein [Bacillales bacterium]